MLGAWRKGGKIYCLRASPESDRTESRLRKILQMHHPSSTSAFCDACIQHIFYSYVPHSSPSHSHVFRTLVHLLFVCAIILHIISLCMATIQHILSLCLLQSSTHPLFVRATIKHFLCSCAPLSSTTSLCWCHHPAHPLFVCVITRHIISSCVAIIIHHILSVCTSPFRTSFLRVLSS